MSEAENTRLMDTEPGGENTAYESQKTFTNPPNKATGTFGDSIPTEASERAKQEKAARGEQTAENIRYGESISEHGFGGETTTNSGGVEAAAGEGDQAPSSAEQRVKMGYGEGGSGVGA